MARKVEGTRVSIWAREAGLRDDSADVDLLRAWLAPRSVRSITPWPGVPRCVRVELDEGPHVLTWSSDLASAALEGAIRGLMGPLVPALPVVDRDPLGAWTLCRLVSGQSLLDVLRTGDAARAGRRIGEVLTRVHAMRYPQPGLLGQHLGLEHAVESLRDAWQAALARAIFEGHAGRRLGVRRVAGLWRLVEREGGRLDDLGDHRLCHGFLEPAAVWTGAAGEVLSLPSWELAWIGPPLFDLGRLTRCADDLPAFVTGVEEGYGAPLPLDWRRTAAIVDLVHLVTVLDDPEERPSLHAKAIAKIEQVVG